MKVQKFTLITLAALVAAGCSSMKQQVVDEADATSKVIQARQDQVRKQFVESEKLRIASQEVDRPFLAGNAKPIAREVVMPDALKRNLPVTALFSRTSVDLNTVMQQLSTAMGMSFSATPDALMPPAMFSSKIAATSGATAGPAQISLNGLQEQMPAFKLLDEVARQANISWRPTPAGVQFYRTDTRVFQLAALSQSATSTSTLGRNAGSNDVFASDSKTSFSLKEQNQLKGIFTTVDAMLTTGGKATISAENQTLVVTDIPAVLDKVTKYIEDENKALSRRVRVIVEALEVVDKRGSDYGLDWNLVLTSARGGDWNLTSPAGLAAATAGALSMAVTDPNSRWTGSTAAIKAISDYATIVNHRSFPFVTTSGRPVTQAVRTTFNYVDQVQVTGVASSGTTATAPTVTQKEETVGTFVTLLPVAKPNGQIFLNISFDVTTAEPLVPFSVGSSSASVTVQQKTVNGTGVVQELPMRSGQTVIVGGIETLNSQWNERRMAPGAPFVLGGGDKVSKNKSQMVLLVTAISEDGI